MAIAGEHAMLSVVSFERRSEGLIHSHTEEQWGVLLEGSGIRIQDGVEVPVGQGDFWHTPGHAALQPFGNGLTTVKSGKREKSRSADQSTRTP